jgi:uncharacterized membrane protein
METLLAIYTAAGLLLAIFSLPLIWQKIKPNPFYGFRVSQTLENPDVWYATNRFAGKRLFVAGISSIIAAIGLYFVPGISVDTYANAFLAVFAIVFIAGFLQSWKYMKSLDK